MIDILSSHRAAIQKAIVEVIEGSASHLDRVSDWAPDFRRRLSDFACGGKLIRGALVVAGAEAMGCTAGTEEYRTAAVMELIQSFLLVHDDIMDEDAVRRGEPAVFEQYRRLGAQGAYRESHRFGESMGICAGDVVVLIALESLSMMRRPASIVTELVRMITSEIADVGVAQMADVANAHGVEQPTEQEILAVYRYKTGRYTFSLPLSLGAVLAGADAALVGPLSEWGELQGIIFQLRDDELGIMEDETYTGKPAGSDIATNKKTLHRLLLAKAAPETVWDHVMSYFGRPVSPAQLAEVRLAMKELGVLAEITERIRTLQAQSDRAAVSLSGAPALCSLLRRIAPYNSQRRT